MTGIIFNRGRYFANDQDTLIVINFKFQNMAKKINTGNQDAAADTNITPEERELLNNAGDGITGDDERLKRAQLDNTDEDGTPLNEKSGANDLSGEDLDVPGSELDDLDEALGEEDEENNNYSGADTE